MINRAVFSFVSSCIAVATIVVGLLLPPGSNWHFTILDIAVDIAAALLFAGLSVAALSVWQRKRRKPGFVVLTVATIGPILLGILAVLLIEGGKASALIFG